MRWWILVMATMSSLTAHVVSAQSAWKPSQTLPAEDAYGRQLKHYVYNAVPRAGLEQMPDDFGNPNNVRDRHCWLQPKAAAALRDLLAEADKDPAVKGTLRGLSCWRDAQYQDGLFCNKKTHKPPCTPYVERSYTSAPPGHSEHGTGYTLDFTSRPIHGCADVDPCFDHSPAGLWLLAHARDFGFELSFPCRQWGIDPATGKRTCFSDQGVMYEPWHWRWVGKAMAAPGASDARSIFAAARHCFQADPRIELDPSEKAIPCPDRVPAPQAQKKLGPGDRSPGPAPEPRI